ncbi:MAG: thiamine phosphate synthase, partial [Bacteroidaceae bacterium]|nr:thiamine phosphate synthase [Bacteroidaceae bacterium]
MLIVITPPHGFAGESERITLMFQSGLQRLHVRKPDCTLDECRRLLQSIPTAYHRRIVLHDHFDLVHEFALGGVHVNRRNPVPPATSIPVSTSCHSLDELREKRKGPFAYLSLSPIFDSVS